MTRIFSLLITGIFLLNLNAQSQWVALQSNKPAPATTTLISAANQSIVLRMEVPGFEKVPVTTPQGQAFLIRVEEGSPLLEAGAPDLVKLTASLAISPTEEMAVRVLSKQYQDFQGIAVAPSKGNLTRDTDPASVAYTYGKVYNESGFYPGFPAQLREPYMFRDVRGQALVVFPFQYDPSTQTLRVLSEMILEVYSTGNPGYNPLPAQSQSNPMPLEYRQAYERHFINFEATKYTPLVDEGKMLILSNGSYIPAMQPFVEWKNMRGIPTEIIDVATIGSTSAAIKNYVSNYYNTQGLTFLLLVGDAAHIPPVTTSNGHSDNDYGYLVGNDHYPEIFVGRFSAESVMDVETQVLRVLQYERDAHTGQHQYTHNIGIASDEGPGDDNEMDYEHIRNMQTDLGNYTYLNSYEFFEGSQGGNDAPGNPSATMVATAINNGAGLILYTGHGSTTSFSTSGFSNSNIAGLTNTGILPFIWSVACVNGNFVNNTCFAEAWMRARVGDQPTGAIATLMSTINQSWNPPMEGQDEMVDILVESYSNNIRRTFGGISMNGCMKMNDTYGSAGYEMTDTWTLFGDPSLVVRTDTPRILTATHQPTLLLGTAQLSVNCAVDDALVTLSRAGQILASEKVSNGQAQLNFQTLTTLDSLTLVVTAYNHIPYITPLTVIPANGPYVIYNHNTISDSLGNQNGLADYGESIFMNVALQNLGVATAGQVSAVLTSTDPMVSVMIDSNFWGDITAGDTSLLQAAFSLSISNAIPDQHPLHFNLEVSDTAGNQWNSALMLKVNAPSLLLESLQINDSIGGNGNGIPEPGESLVITIPVSNAGHSDAGAAQLYLASSEPLAVLNANSQTLSGLAAGGMSPLSFNLHLDTSLALGSSLALHSHLNAGAYSDTRTYYLPIGNITEDFETGDFTRFNWNFGGNANWTVQSNQPFEGLFCAKSGPIGNNASSTMEITLNVLVDDTISFYRKVSSEQGYDFLRFYIDNNKMGEWSGNEAWAMVSYPVTAGTHTFKWTYVKDWYVSSGSDCGWIDYISFPPVNVQGAAPLSVVALAGDPEICTGESTQLMAFANGGSGNYTYLWSPATGLNDPTLANPVAHPAGNTQYTVSISDGNGSASAIADVVVHPLPATPSITQQGNDLVSSAASGNQWYGAQGAIAGANGQVFTPSSSGDYYTIVSSQEGCDSDPSNVIAYTISGLEENAALQDFLVFPNPTTGELNLSLNISKGEEVLIRLMDVTGQELEVLWQKGMAQGMHKLQFDLSYLPSGIYYLRLEQGTKAAVKAVILR